MRLLYEHMSDRNLAETIALVTNEPENVILNEVYRVSVELALNDASVQNVVQRLSKHGFEEWCREE